MHAVDGLEEREHGRVIGDAPAPQVVALHAVDEGGDGVLQSLQELVVALVCLAVLVLLLGRPSERDGETINWKPQFQLS